MPDAPQVPAAESGWDLGAFEAAIGYRFRDRDRLRQALAHTSYASERGLCESNERLEFLGDGVLSAAAAQQLFESFPGEDEGELSRKKSHLVSRARLAEVGVELDIGRWLYLGSGEDRTGGRQKPSVLANAVEALIGAIALDGGFEAARDFVARRCLGDMEAPESDFKTRLQEVFQNRFHALPVYETSPSGGPEHDRTFESEVRMRGKVLGRGSGKTKKAAEQKAAQEALRSFK